ncbi:MAG: DUF4240 domain-containing protein [Planctomycetota bacterium]
MRSTARAKAQSRSLAENLKDLLLQSDVASIVQFHVMYDAATEHLESFKLSGAFSALGGGSEDSYGDFKAWIVSQGLTFANRVRSDPDCLATLGRLKIDDVVNEEVQYSAVKAFRKKAGAEFIDVLYKDYCEPEAIRVSIRESFRGDPVEPDHDWTKTGDYQEVVPRLFKLYGSS